MKEFITALEQIAAFTTVLGLAKAASVLGQA